MSKLEYTKKELLKVGWATIGGRIEDYEKILKTKGIKAAYSEISKTYKKDADDVFRGLLVFDKYGTSAYYDERMLESSNVDLCNAYEKILKEDKQKDKIKFTERMLNV